MATGKALTEEMQNCFGLHPLKPRDRIIATARDLFRKHGIRGIGVDAIAEAAGTNKMTLYRHFGSKDELVAECLRDVAREVDAFWQEAEAKYPDDPLARLRAWVIGGSECLGEDGRGCEIANVAVELAEDEHPARQVIEEFKQDQRKRLVKLCGEAGVAQAELLADTLILLLEGARVSRQAEGKEGPCARFVVSAEAVIASFAPGSGAGKRARAAEKIAKAAAPASA